MVIVNDRYGVKVNKVIAGAEDMPVPKHKPAQEAGDEQAEGVEDFVQNEEAGEEQYNEGEYQEGGEYTEPGEAQEGEQGEEEFDYSDFDLDDDNI